MSQMKITLPKTKYNFSFLREIYLKREKWKLHEFRDQTAKHTELSFRTKLFIK